MGDTDGASKSAALPDHIYMDAMAFGMGCCCLQMTFQACNIQEARLLYDQLTPLCPILVFMKYKFNFFEVLVCKMYTLLLLVCIITLKKREISKMTSYSSSCFMSIYRMY